jgi:hypothetical protein
MSNLKLEMPLPERDSVNYVNLIAQKLKESEQQ